MCLNGNDKSKNTNSYMFYYAFFVILLLGTSLYVFWCYSAETRDIMQSYHEENMTFLENIDGIVSLSDREQLGIIVEQEENYDKFMAEYYNKQSDWLNRWLTVIAILITFMGIMIPFVLMRSNKENKDELQKLTQEFRRTQREMNDTHDKMKNAVVDVNSHKLQIESDIKAQQEKMQEEIKEVKEYVEKAKESEKQAKISALFSEGANLARKEKFEEAKKNFEEILKLSPKHEKALFNLGQCYANTNDFENAKKYHLEALSINPNFFNALASLGSCYHQEGNYDSALVHYNEALKLKNDMDILYNVIEVDILQSNFSNALINIKEFIKTDDYILENDKPKWLEALNQHRDNDEVQQLIEIINKLKIKLQKA